MLYTGHVPSPLGDLLIAGTDTELVGIWFEDAKYFGSAITEPCRENMEAPVIAETAAWLSDYFAGLRPKPERLRLRMIGSDFRCAVWKLLLQIPYGSTMTYGEIASAISRERGTRVSAQAVGGAVGHNPISVVIPCHRVVGANGSLTGYAGGLDRKRWLLQHESGAVVR